VTTPLRSHLVSTGAHSLCGQRSHILRTAKATPTDNRRRARALEEGLEMIPDLSRVMTLVAWEYPHMGVSVQIKTVFAMD